MGDGKHTDQELYSHILHGFRLGPIAEQWFLPPHLFGLACAFDSTQSEIRRLAGLGYSQLYQRIPFWPMRGMCCGATPRKYCDRWRRTNDFGNPYESYPDADGVPIVSINEAATLPRVVDGVTYVRPKERKPSLRGALRDLMVHMHHAFCTGQVVFLFTDDIKDYFNQLGLADQELWKSVMVTLAAPPDPWYSPAAPSLSFSLEAQFGFGFIGSSHEAQRLSNVIIDEHARRALPDNRRIILQDRSPRNLAWVKRRVALEEKSGLVEFRSCSGRMYTDDSLLMSVGIPATLDCLKHYREVVTESGLRMASADKRQAGIYVVWLGVMIFSVLGLAMVTTAKLLNSQAACTEALSGYCEFQNYRRLVGMLEHIRVVNGEPRLATLGFYAPHRLGLSPNQWVAVTPLMEQGLRRWIEMLSTVGGATLLMIHGVRDLVRTGGLLVHMSSDAAKDGALIPALGGYCNGLFWVFPLSEKHLALLVIGVLELLASLLNVIVFWATVRHFNRVVQTADALATPQVLVKMSARSPLMQVALDAAMHHPTFADAVLSGRLFIVHGWGDTNAPADFVSRGNMEAFYQLMRMLRVRPRQLLVSAADARVVDTTLVAAEAMRDGTWGVAPLRPALLTAAGADVPVTIGRLPGPTGGAPPSAGALPPISKRRKVRRGARSGVRHATMMVMLLFTCGDVEHHPGPSWLAALLACDERGTTKIEPLPHVRKVLPDTSKVSSSLATDASCLSALLDCDATGTYLDSSRAFSLSKGIRKRNSKREAWKRSGRSFAASYDALPDTPQSYDTAGALASELLDDDSEFALRPSNLTQFHEQVHHLSKLVLAGVKAGTRAADRNAWKYHVAWCEMYNTPVHRTNVAMQRNPLREAFREASTMMMAAQMIRPRSNLDVEAKPGSSYQIVLSIRRILGYSGVVSGKFSYTRKVLAGFSQAFMAVHGKDSLRPRRKEALPDEAYAAMFAIPKGEVVGTLVAGDPAFETLLDLVSVLDDTGMRKAEVITQPDELFLQCMMWGDVSWYIHGHTYVRPSAALLRSMDSKCYVLVTPTNSKCDATNEIWGNHPMAIPFEKLPSNAAFRLRARYLELGIVELSPDERKRLALFADAYSRPLTGAVVDRHYHCLLKHVLPRTYQLYSVHSHRIRLACRLRRINASDGRIQAMCRWMSPESLHIYARWDIHQYARWVRKSRKANATTLETTNLPVLGDEHGRDAMHLSNYAESRRGKASVPATYPTAAESFPSQNSKPPAAPKSRKTTSAYQPSRVVHTQHSVLDASASDIGDCPRCSARPPSARSLLPARVVAIRRHAAARCYWMYTHPDVQGEMPSIPTMVKKLDSLGVDNNRSLPTTQSAAPPLGPSPQRRRKRKRVAAEKTPSSGAAPTLPDLASWAKQVAPQPRFGPSSPAKGTRSQPRVDLVRKPHLKRRRLMAELDG